MFVKTKYYTFLCTPSPKNMSSPATLNDIAHVNEILHCMFTFLDDFTILKQLSLVCKQWNHVVWNMIDFGF
jgi:hypothetical protein